MNRMKKYLRQLSRTAGLQIALLIALSGYGAVAAETNTTDGVVKSVFQETLPNGKDPFFPKSTRRAEKVSSSTEPIIPPSAQLALKGISGPANRRFALINNQTLAAGELASVRVPSGLVKVRCWEIHDNSVVVSIEGNPERKELRLKE